MEANNYKNIESQKRRDDSHDSFMIKAVLWFIALCVVGFIACVILGMLKVAIQAVVIIAVVLMFIALLGWVAYEKIKARIRERHKNDSD